MSSNVCSLLECQGALEKLNGLTYVPCTAKLDLLDALAEAGANPVKSCLQARYLYEIYSVRICEEH